MRKIKSTLLSVLLLAFLSATCILVSCGGDDDGDDATCTGCESDAPWSTVSATECYVTQAECEAAEDGNCQRCN